MQTKSKEDQKLKSVSMRQPPKKQLLTWAKKQDAATFSVAKHGALDR